MNTVVYNQATTNIMASLNGVDSNGVSQQVIDAVERFREWHEDLTDYAPEPDQRFLLPFDMAVSERDAEYIVEFLQVLLIAPLKLPTCVTSITRIREQQVLPKWW
jgi:hypothetical protein